jgi:CDP-glycerol glycerophosphotransferase (TagB/SpsB family)
VEEIIKAIPRNEFEIIIKIHPTLENLKDYTNIVEPINSSVNVTQNANLVELILNADIIITPVSGTSAVCALIARKPIIIWNVFNVENDALIQNELALPCKDQKMILEQIRKAETWLPNEEKIEQFTREYLHASDGKASERTAVEIVNFLKIHKPHLF